MAERSNLEIALESLEKSYGKGSVISSSYQKDKCDVISSGSIGLDKATGIGGFPRGKIIELMGWESSGKSTITLHTIANAQKNGIKCLLIDGENSFDKGYAKNLGVDIDALLISQPSYGEEGYNIAEKLIETGEIGLVVIDSQTSLLPKKVIDGDAGDNAIGLHARLMSQVVPKLMIKGAAHNCAVIVISQYREKIGVMFGDPRTTSGGHALKFYSHMRVEVSKSLEKDGTTVVANKTKCKVIKNKLAAPFGQAEFIVNFGEGISVIDEILDFGNEKGILKKWGKQITYPLGKEGEKKYSIEEFTDLLKDNAEFLESIKGQI